MLVSSWDTRTLLVGVQKWYSPVKNCYEVNIHLPYNPTILLIGISPMEMKNKKICTRMFIAVFPYPKLETIHTSNNRRKEKWLMHTTILMNLIAINCQCMIPCIWSSRTGKSKLQWVKAISDGGVGNGWPKGTWGNFLGRWKCSMSHFEWYLRNSCPNTLNWMRKICAFYCIKLYPAPSKKNTKTYAKKKKIVLPSRGR